MMWVIICEDCIITVGQKKLWIHPNAALDVSNMVEENMMILFSLAFATTYRLLLWVT